MAKQTHGIIEKRLIKIRKGFNHKRYKELLYNPPSTIKNYLGIEFRVDKDVFYKMCQYVYDMVFSTLDVIGWFIGGEGSGKSTHASQYGQMIYYIMLEVNILRKDLGTYYDYVEEECLAHNLESFLELSDKYNDDLFRIIICDEAGDLKSEDRWNEENKNFRQSMRKDRKKLRFRLLCYPKLEELVGDVILGRSNFIVFCDFSKNSNGNSIPDEGSLLIIPRQDFTYSYHSLLKIPKGEILKILNNLKKEKYIGKIDNKYIYKTYKRDDVFCFDPDKYIKNAKEHSRIQKQVKKVYLTEAQIYILAESLTAGKLGLSTKKPKAGFQTEQDKKEWEFQKKKAQNVNKIKWACVEYVRRQEEILLKNAKRNEHVKEKMQQSIYNEINEENFEE